MIQVKRFLPFQAILQFLMVGWLSLAIINAKIEAAAPVITEGPTTSVAMSKNGVPTAFALTLNATDSENDTLTWSILAGAANGNAIVSSTPTGTFQEIQYTPNTDFSGNDSFEVQVSDGIATASITVNVQIDAVNNSPAINEDTKLLALNGTTEDYFGYSVAISGNLAIVGCPRDDDGSMNSGSAYVYTRTAGNTWMQQFKLTALDSEADDEFGYSVAISGNLAIVGSPSDDDGGVNSGSAYVYATSGNTWVQQCKLSASDPAQEDLFGLTVAISGNIAIVGCSMDDDGSTTDAGSAYVYANTTGNTWVQQCKLSASDLAANDRFGCSVAVSGNLVIVGSFWDDDSATDSGSAYSYANTTGNTWIQQCKLYASDPSMNDNFGFSVAISGNLAIVGSAADDDAGTSSGSAYIYANTTGNNWVHQFKLNASGAAGGDQFGYSVAISGNLALVGCYGDDDAGTDSGSAYVYANTTGNTWVEQTKLTASDAAAGDNFGSCLAISGNNVIVSSVFDDYAGPITGSAYAFSLPLTITSPVVPFASIGPEANASEGGGYTGSHYTAVISSPVVTDTTINIAISGTATNTDYTLSGDNVTWAGGASVIVVIAAGTTSSAIILTPVDDAIAEGGETVALMLDDGIGYTHDLATSMIFIFDNENSAPVITEGPSASVTMSQNGTPTNFALTLHATDADIVSANYDSLTWSILGVATNGTASVSSTTPTGSFQEIQYTPNTDFLGNDSFDIQVCDGTDSATITVNVTILAIYDVPIINENAKLFALDGEADDNFGFSVAISGNLAIVGSPGEDHVGDCSGAAYIYARTENNTWVQQFKLTALDAAVWSSFGNAVAISGNLAIVGSWADDSNGYDSGSAYVFASTSGNTWIQQCKLTSSNPQTEDYFGISVAISGNIVIVGNVLDSVKFMWPAM